MVKNKNLKHANSNNCWFVCARCEDEFDSTSPTQKDRQRNNVCVDCELPDDHAVKPVRAFINATDDGDFLGINIMSNSKFQQAKKFLGEPSLDAEEGSNETNSD